MFALTPSPITGDNYPALADNYLILQLYHQAYYR